MPKYRTIVVDPPWAFDQTWATNGKPFLFYGAEGVEPPKRKAPGTIQPRGAVAKYSVMSIAEIAATPVGEWAENENAHMYIWTTNTFMVEAHELMKGWGFRQKTILTWVKPKLGMGTYYRNNTEHVLFGVRPKSPVLRKDVRPAFSAEQGRHSEKPAAFYDIVQSMSPPPYLDVFARRNRFGWDAFGDECFTPPDLQKYLPEHEKMVQ
ncbi:hypothetical protein LCGC14_1711320 [marine sediment metagenome]|uniref:DNA methylase N-4/N-6 domain-containing protein n=1 Tax=marine sediment metagenome TaxID=412755 RepID=A0A0F9HEP7_9ZZZZ